MINSSTDGDKLLLKTLPLELILHAMVLMLFWRQYQADIKTAELVRFTTVVAGVLSVKIIFLCLRKLRYSSTSETHAGTPGATTTAVLFSSNIFCGLCWGLGISYFSLKTANLNLADPYLFLLVTNLFIAAIVGAALWSWLFSSFIISLAGAPIYFLIKQDNLIGLTVWLSLIISTLALFKVAYALETTFKTFRQAGRKNTTILKELAEARQQAVEKQRETNQINEKLKSEMQQRLEIEEKIRASERETSRILQDMQETYFRVDEDGRFTHLSPSARILFSSPIDALLDKPFESVLIDGGTYQALLGKLQKSGGFLQNFETRISNSSDKTSWISINAHFSNMDINDHCGFEGIMRDITDNKRAAELIAQEKNRLHITLESIGDAVVTTDAKGLVTYLNPMAEMMSGWDTSEVANKPFAQVVTLLDEEGEKEVQLPLQQWLRSESRGQLNDPMIVKNRKSGKCFTIEVTGSPILDANKNCSGFVLVFRNMTKLRALTKQLSYQATHDALTGLINRKEFDSRVEAALRTSKTEEKTHGLCYIDLDQFKIVNDTCGHHAGDTLLIEVTKMLQQILRSSDTLARLGGDEFGVLLIGCTLEKAQALAEACRKAVENYRLNWKGRVFRIGASIGLVPIDHTTGNLEELLISADAACYKAKEQGRNNVQVVRIGDQAIAQEQVKMNLMQRIQSALEHELFELHFQTIAPINRTQTNGRCAEVLIRMLDETSDKAHAVIPPGAFLPTAERYQLMSKIDKWVISNTLKYFANNSNEQQQWDMCSINISGQTLSEVNILEWVMEQFELSKVPPRLICFEISEAAAVENQENAINFIKNLKSKGCRFALDDFGAGISSFGHLNKFPVQYIKIDGSLVKEIIQNVAGYAVLEAINNIAHVVDVLTIAEHVESDNLKRGLEQLGVDFIQGNAVDKPIAFLTPAINKKAS